MPLNSILKKPNEIKWRNVNTGGSLLKQVSNINSSALGILFVGLGFTMLQEKSFKFMKQDEKMDDMMAASAADQGLKPDEIIPGNLKTLQYAFTYFDTKME